MSVSEEEFEAIMDAMPERMDDSEVCAMILSIMTAYIDSDTKIMSLLLSAVYTYAAAIGVPREKVSASLRRVADEHDRKQKPTKH